MSSWTEDGGEPGYGEVSDEKGLWPCIDEDCDLSGDGYVEGFGWMRFEGPFCSTYCGRYREMIGEAEYVAKEFHQLVHG